MIWMNPFEKDELFCDRTAQKIAIIKQRARKSKRCVRLERRDAVMDRDGQPLRTVLIVDDETPSRELLKMSCDWAHNGLVAILEARTGAEALALYRAQHP